MHDIPETFLLSNISFLSYPMNNFLKEGKQTSTAGSGWKYTQKSKYSQFSQSDHLPQATTLYKYPFYFKNSLVRDYYLNFLNDRDHYLG